MDINSTLVKTIDYIVSQRINDLPIDKTITGTIESKNEDGTYSILEGSLRFVALGNGQNYRSGQQVLVFIPGGDYSNDNKIILGLKSAMATSEQLMPYVRPRDKMIHVDDEGIKELIEGQVYRNIENYYRRCNCVSVSANVKTNFAHNITEGSYGLLVHILDGEKIVETLDLNNKKDMFGNTFKFVTALPQEVTYSVDLSGVSLNGLGVKYETYIGDLYYINDNNQKVLYHPTGEEITFSNIVVSFGFDTTQKPAKELDFLLKDADTLQLLWYNMDASGKSWEFTDGEFNLDYAINYKKYQEQVNEMLILEDYSALTDEEQALFKKLYNPEKGKEAEVFDQLRKGEYKGVNPFDKIYYGVEWKITNKKESGLWKTFETDGETQAVKPRQSKWQNTYVKAVVYRNGEIFEKVYDGVFENPIVTETSEDGHIYYTGIKLIHDQSSRPHYDCYGYTNLVTNSEDMITRKVKWSSILNEEYSIEEPPKLQPLGVYWYVPANNTMLVPIGEKNEEKPMVGYDCYRADVFDYKIKSHFAPYDKNNTLKCRVYLDNVNYYEAELTFSFTTKGTMGTDYSLIIKEEYDRYAATAPSEELNFYNSIVRDPNGQEVEKWSEEDTNGVKIEAKKPQTYPGIVEVTATWNDGESRLKAYQPIALNSFGKTLYYQGPTEVVYDPLGSNPRYDKSSPKLIDENGAVLEGIVWSNTITNTGGMTELAVESSYTSMADYQIKTIKATRNEKVIWEQPIIMFQDVYGNSYLNKWDGKLSLDNSTGRVLASMIGAGHKDEDNKFTGVLMGDIQKTDASTVETGVFGLSKGVQTFALKTDGTAIIGRENNGIIFSGEEQKIRNANESVVIDFSDGDQFRIDEIKEVELNQRLVGVSIIENGEEEYYKYEKNFIQGEKFQFITESVEEEKHIVKILINGEEKPLGPSKVNDNSLVYEYTAAAQDDAYIGKLFIETPTDVKSYISYIDIIPENSFFKFDNGQLSMAISNFDLQSKNVKFDGDQFTITSDSRSSRGEKEILHINDQNYLLRSQNFTYSQKEHIITEFNLIYKGFDITNAKIYQKIQDKSSIITLGKGKVLAFKTKDPVGTDVRKLAYIKSSGEGVDIGVNSDGCLYKGNWVKAFICNEDELEKAEADKTGYFGELETVYLYPGDDGKKIKLKDDTAVIVPRQTRVTKNGITGTEFDLMKQTLKMAGLKGDIYIGVNTGDNISDEEAKEKIFIGGEKYALRIGKFKIDWEGNQVK